MFYNRKVIFLNNYIVYKHTSPSNKVYIGITCRTMEARSEKGGIGYSGNKYFYKAIEKYGWDNFTHEILFQGLSKDEACNKEIELIKFYNSTNPKFGYNICAGGEGRLNSFQSEITKQKISEASKQHWNNPETRKRMIEGLKGRKVSDETKNKISNAQKGKYVPPEVCEKISKSKKGKHPWNYGKKCEPRSEETKAKISAYNKGKTISEEHKQAISAKLKGREITPEWRAKISSTLKAKNEEKRCLNENI